MATAVVEHVFTGTTTTVYDPEKTTLGSLIVQNTGTTTKDKWIGPKPTTVAQCYDIPGIAAYTARPFVLNIDTDIDWIFVPFGAVTSSGVAVPYILFYEFKKSTFQFKYKGFLYFSIPYAGTQGTYGIYATSVSRHLYTTGTVSASGTSVTGTDTAWQTARYAVGARIGFGSTDPSQVTTWSEIATVGSDTSLTLTSNVGTIAGGTAFVIEELRICMALQNSTTTTNAGLFLVKGLHPDLWSSYARTIPAAVSTDNQRAVYWLAETATTVMTTGIGVPASAPESDTTHYLHFMNSPAGTNLRIYEFNIRASLSSISSGRTTSAYLFETALSGTITGLYPGTNEVITAAHGPGAGKPNIYVAATTRIHRIPVSQIFNGSLSFIMDGFMEIPTGSTSNYAAAAAMYSVCYSPTIDRFITSPTNTTSRGYITKYDTNGAIFENWFGLGFSQYDRAATWPDFAPTFTSYITVVRTSPNGILYLVRSGASGTPGNMYAVPLVHWDYVAASGQRVITPAFNLIRFNGFEKLYVNAATLLGSNKYGSVIDPFRVYARTSGIDDNSGTWTLINDTGDLSTMNPLDYRWNDWPTQIQFMFEFSTPYWTCIGARIHSLSFTYNQLSTDTHFKPSIYSNKTNKIFCWKFVEAFGTTVPALRVLLFDENDQVLEDDNTEYPRGSFQKSIDGGRTWAAWDNADRTNDQTFVRYAPNSLSINKKIKMVLTIR